MANMLSNPLASNTARPRGNLVLRVDGFDTNANAISGEVMSGPAAGQSITVNLPKREKAHDVASLQEHVKEGVGSVQIERVAPGKDESFDASYVKVFHGGVPKDGHEDVTLHDQTVRLVNMRNGSKALERMKVDDQVTISEQPDPESGLAAFRGAVHECFKNGDNAAVFLSIGEDTGTVRLYLGGEKTDDGYKPNDPEARTNELMEALANTGQDEVYKKAAQSGKISVMPMDRFFIGRDTVTYMQDVMDAAKEGNPVQTNFLGVNPFQFNNLPLSARVAGVMRRTDENAPDADQKAAFKAAFLATASEAGKQAYHEHGWHKVPGKDLARTFEQNGVELMDMNRYDAWAKASVSLRRKEGPDDPENNGFVMKAFVTAAAQPFPRGVDAVVEHGKAYSTEIAEGIKQFDGPKATASASQTKDAAAEEPSKPADAAKAPEADDEVPMADMDDIDETLNDIGDDNVPM